MEQNLECIVCFRQYDLLYQKPVCLVPCGHTYCSTCAKVLINNKKLCPLDNSLIESQIPNWAMQQIIKDKEQPQIQVQEAGKFYQEQKCHLHVENPLNLFCQKDKEWICQSCALFGAHKGHKIMDKAMLAQEQEKEVIYKQEQLERLQQMTKDNLEQNNLQIQLINSLVRQAQANIEQSTQLFLQQITQFQTKIAEVSQKAVQTININNEDILVTLQQINHLISIQDQKDLSQTQNFSQEFEAFVNRTEIKQVTVNKNQVQQKIQKFQNILQSSLQQLLLCELDSFGLYQENKNFKQMIEQRDQKSQWGKYDFNQNKNQKQNKDNPKNQKEEVKKQQKQESEFCEKHNQKTKVKCPSCFGNICQECQKIVGCGDCQFKICWKCNKECFECGVRVCEVCANSFETHNNHDKNY